MLADRRLAARMSLKAKGRISSLLFGIAPTDPGTMAAPIAIIVLVSALAGYLPARRASRIDPIAALRYE